MTTYCPSVRYVVVTYLTNVFKYGLKKSTASQGLHHKLRSDISEVQTKLVRSMNSLLCDFPVI